MAERPIELPPVKGGVHGPKPVVYLQHFVERCGRRLVLGRTRHGEIIARGLAATEALARAEAMRAALSHVNPPLDDLAPSCLDDPRPDLEDPLSFGAS